MVDPKDPNFLFDGRSRLHVAAQQSADQTQALLADGADPNIRNWRGETPLHRAATVNWDVQASRHLIGAGADVNARDMHGHTPLHRAAAFSSLADRSQVLIDAGADPNERDATGNTPLHVAVFFNNRTEEVIPALIKAGANPNLANEKGETPLHRAALRAEDSGTISRLVHGGADVNARNRAGNTPLHLAAGENGSPHITKALLEHGADPDARNTQGQTPVDAAKRAPLKPDGPTAHELRDILYGAAQARSGAKREDQLQDTGRDKTESSPSRSASTKVRLWLRGKDYAAKVSGELIDQIKAGVAPFQKPWKPGEQFSPENLSTGKKYRGGNSLYLMSRAIRDGRGDNRWGTYNQIREAGGQVRKGEKGTQVLFFTDRNSRAAKDEKGQTMKDKEGKTIYEQQKREKPICKQYTVFNVEQAEGLELKPREAQVRPDWDAHRDAEKVIAASGPTVVHVAGDRAYYRMADDKIVLPEPSQFPTRNGYYQTALHECGHATGHPDRLNRATLKEGLNSGFGSPEYAREELRAEISAMMTGERVGVGHDPERGAAYVENWVKVLEKDPHEIHRAARDAQEMTDHLMQRAINREVAKPTKEKTRAQLTQQYSHARGPQISQTPNQSPQQPAQAPQRDVAPRR